MNLITGKNKKILRTPAKPVEKITPEIRQLVRQMKKTMKESRGIGLAAPQVGVNLQIFVAQTYYQDEGYQGKLYAIINPKIVSLSKQTDKMEEGCLSLPKIYGEVERPKKITIEGLDEMGKKIKIKASGLLAKIFQHEIDHLNGILFVDKSPNAEKSID
ncbi:MAG: peptide deformylase [Patescibacteria group bacterium]